MGRQSGTYKGGPVQTRDILEEILQLDSLDKSSRVSEGTPTNFHTTGRFSQERKSRVSHHLLGARQSVSPDPGKTYSSFGFRKFRQQNSLDKKPFC